MVDDTESCLARLQGEPTLVAVVIGRNEAAHLALALESVQRVSAPLVYIDSASTDASVAIASSLRVSVISLAVPPILSAARARNEGLLWMSANYPAAELVLFLDGDCELISEFLDPAVLLLRNNPKVAVVVGQLRERNPHKSVYSRLSSLEWTTPAGEIKNFAQLGGIMIARASALNEVGGFNAQMVAGEDSELGVRLSLAAYQVVKIDQQMAVHENGITDFRGWWRRSVRAGHALSQRYCLNGGSPLHDCRREFYSTIFWGIGIPAVSLLLAYPTKGISLLLGAGYGLLAARIFQHARLRGALRKDALLYSAFGILSKFANAKGMMMFLCNSLSGRYHLIEYKRSQPRGHM